MIHEWAIFIAGYMAVCFFPGHSTSLRAEKAVCVWYGTTHRIFLPPQHHVGNMSSLAFVPPTVAFGDEVAKVITVLGVSFWVLVNAFTSYS